MLGRRATPLIPISFIVLAACSAPPQTSPAPAQGNNAVQEEGGQDVSGVN